MVARRIYHHHEVAEGPIQIAPSWHAQAALPPDLQLLFGGRWLLLRLRQPSLIIFQTTSRHQLTQTYLRHYDPPCSRAQLRCHSGTRLDASQSLNTAPRNLPKEPQRQQGSPGVTYNAFSIIVKISRKPSPPYALISPPSQVTKVCFTSLNDAENSRGGDQVLGSRGISLGIL